MKRERFTGQLLNGHKGAAIEVPFDPSVRWAAPPERLWAGRNGHAVRGQLNGVVFESVVVGRQKRFYLLVPEDLCAEIDASIGDTVRVVVSPATESQSETR